MKKLGWLVVNKSNGYLVEGKDRAAKIHELATARTKCNGSSKTLVPISYESLVASLHKGSSFCFESDDTHGKFLRRLRNDMANKPFAARSQDKDFIQWKQSDAIKPAANPGEQPAPQPMAGSSVLSVDIPAGKA